MKRDWIMGMAGIIAGLSWTLHAPASEPAAPVAGPPDASFVVVPDSAGPADAAEAEAASLCATVEEGARLLREYHLAPTNGEVRKAVLESMIRASDPTVVFLNGEELEARRRRDAGEWTIGLTLVMSEGLPKIAAVRAASPAEAAGILSGEFLEKVGGRELGSKASLKQVRDLLTDGDAAALEVGILDTNGESRVVTLERVPRTGSALTDVENLPAGMGYMRISDLVPGGGEEIRQVLDGWRQDGLFGGILDLRGAGGKAAEEVVAVAAAFVPDGDVLYTLSTRSGDRIETVAVPETPEATMPLMVLVDEGTEGASELLAVALVGSVKGVMSIGRETAGDPLIREPVALSTGTSALLAIRQVETADGTVYAGGGGLVPDVWISDAALDETVYEPDQPILRKGKKMSEEEKEDKALRMRTRNDTYLRRATDVLLGLKALGYDGKP